MNKHILAVDDDARNLKLIKAYLAENEYEVTTATDAEKAWELLQESGLHFDLILLDRMMPGTDGIAFLKRFNKHANDKSIPIIMQTAASSSSEIREGLELGVFYYLTKPYDDEVLLPLVHAALEDAKEAKKIRAAIEAQDQVLGLVTKLSLELSTLDESRVVAAMLAKLFPDPERVVLGISELLINAIEHGNLGITYEEKGELKSRRLWLEEIEKRSRLEGASEKKVYVEFLRLTGALQLTIRDEGEGFDWSHYIDFDIDRASDSHGRGIAMAKMLSFDELNYTGNGNTVICKVSF